MENLSIGVIALYLVVGFIAWRVLKSIIRVIIVLGVVTLLLVGASTYYVYKDIVDIRANVKSGNIVLMHAEGDLIAGFSVEEEDVVPFTAAQLAEYTAHYGKEDYGQILGEQYKLMVLDSGMMDLLSDKSVDIDGTPIPMPVVEAALKSSNPGKVMSSYFAQAEVLEPHEIKAILLGAFFTEHIIQSPVFSVGRLKDGTYIVYPETAVFKALKLLPLGLIKTIAEKTVETGGEVTEGVKEKVSS